jgi:hypothetical protein
LPVIHDKAVAEFDAAIDAKFSAMPARTKPAA